MTDNTNISENEKEVLADTAEDMAEKENGAVAKAEKPKRSPENSPAFLIRLVATLCAICVAIAVLLAAVNAVTRDKIADNTMKSKTEAVLSIFSKGTDCELYKTLEDGSEVYLAYRGEDIIGYCAFVSSVGFGGKIDMMVGINGAYETEGVKIVSMSETPGVGSKTGSSEFLGRFVGLGHSDPTGAVDAISGATISSTAVKAGVNQAHSIEVDLEAVCSEKGCSLLTPDMLASITEESTEETTVPDTSEEETDATAESTTPAETEHESSETAEESTTPAETEDVPFVNNPGMRDFIYNIDASAGSDRFVIEIPKDDETATFETTKEPETVPPATEAPVTEPPVTEAPATNPPVTEAPATNPPVTVPPVTAAPPATNPSVTESPITEPASTEPPEETDDPNEIPPWLDTQPEETIPSWLDTQPKETAPSWIGG